MQGPLAVSPVVPKDVAFAFWSADTEVLGAWVVPAIFDSVDVMDILDSILANRRAQREAKRTLVRFVAGVGFDMKGRDIDQILNDRRLTGNLSTED